MTAPERCRVDITVVAEDDGGCSESSIKTDFCDSHQHTPMYRRSETWSEADIYGSWTTVPIYRNFDSINKFWHRAASAMCAFSLWKRDVDLCRSGGNLRSIRELCDCHMFGGGLPSTDPLRSST